MASIALAIAAGFRPSTALLLGPLWLVSICRIHGIHRLLAILCLALGLLAWFLPMTAASGGIAAYFSSLAHLWLMVPGKRTTLSDPWLAVGRSLTIVWIFILCFGAASLLFLVKENKPQAARADRARTRFVQIWIAPGLLFFVFVFLNYVNSGYLLVLSPPIFALLADRAYQFVADPKRRRLRWTAAAAGVAANCVFFGWAPLYCTQRGVREFEAEMKTIRDEFQKRFNPEDTLIIGFDSHFLGYRHAGYYLPAFVTAQYPEVGYPEGKRVFIMHDGDTQLLRSFRVDRFQRFVFFPLPKGAEYTAYLDQVRCRFPEGVLSHITVGDERVWSGPASAIRLLFGSTAVTPEGLYTPLHLSR